MTDLPLLTLARSELILGGQKSGKSRRAESLASCWLGQSPEHEAVLIATAQPQDDEMRERIARHRQGPRRTAARHVHGGRAAATGPGPGQAQSAAHAGRGRLPDAVVDQFAHAD